MDKNLIKEVIKEMFKNNEINIYVANTSDSFDKSITTEIQVYINGEEVQVNNDTTYLE